MAINITPKNDYSYLFSSLSSGSSSGSAGNLNFLSDYASIKNGSYGKLMKAYYSESASDEVSRIAKNSTSIDTTKNLQKMQAATDDLKESADALLVSGEKSLFAKRDVTVENEDGTKTTTQEYDTEAIYDAVSQLVEDYNAVLDASNKISTKSILNKTMNMVTAVNSNETILGKVGISVKEDGALSIDKKDFLKADMGTVKTLFGQNGSLGYRISAHASLINYATTNEVNRSNTYTPNGTYSSTYSAGDLFTGLF